jgi:signal transduction histidine kinase
VRVRPLNLAEERVYVVVFHDITSLKWRDLQNRMFLHDLGNMLTGLGYWSEELVEATSENAAAQIIAMVRRMNDSLESHRLLSQCESGEMKLSPQRITSDVLVADLHAWFDKGASEAQCEFVIKPVHVALNLVTDMPLLMRVLGNLIKNAIEASEPGRAVTLAILARDDSTTFSVHNAGVIPELVAAQLFKSRLSTKGRGRGLGMYAVQVFGEQLLGGHVEFESTNELGTVFRFTLPNAPAVEVH